MKLPLFIMTIEQTIARFERLVNNERNMTVREIAYRLAHNSVGRAIRFLEVMAAFEQRQQYRPRPVVETKQPSHRPVHKPNPMCFGFKPFGRLFRNR